MEQYLRSTPIINWSHPNIQARAQQLAAGQESPTAIARQCFEWVRDHIQHSVDYRMNPVTCVASDVLEARTGFCYAKSHLLVALCRANGIPAGLCYQRLQLDLAAGNLLFAWAGCHLIAAPWLVSGRSARESLGG